MASAGLPPRPADSKGRTWVFNPPPGWPVPPVGWQPEPGWQPDPSWPPAPVGWNFWKPEQDSGRYRVSTFVKALVGALTLAATIAGTYLAWVALHQNQPTTANWVREANAACDQDIGTLYQSVFNGLAPSTVTQGDSSAQSSQVNKINALIAAVSSLSKLVGDLGALQTPQDSRAPQVQAVLNSGNALVSSLETFSNAAQLAVENTSGTATSQDLATELKAEKQFLINVVAWRKAIGKLGLTRCPFWVSNPNVPPATLPPTPQQTPTASLTPGEQQLVSQLNPNDLTNCYGRPALEGGGIVAAVNCQNVQAGPTLQPLVVQFSDIDSALAWFNNNTVGFVDRNDCADGYKLGTWTHNYIVAGVLGCAYVANGDFRMVWVIDSALIGVIADGSYGPTMNEWWTDSAYVVYSND